MAKFNFEDYRQPWETGPHWELKREFMEKYQNDFDEDRLLCLAQAYSNIELMNCSYPDPVMWQVNELSKSLNGCKRFREANEILETERNAAKNKKGKRTIADEDTNKSYKFIKFCSAKTSNDIKSGEPHPSESSVVIDPVHQSLSKHSESKASCDSLNEKNCEFPDIKRDLKSDDMTDSKVMNLTNMENADGSNPIFQISKSQDIKLLEKISCALKIYPKPSREALENVIDKLDLQSVVNCTSETIGKTCFCKFYIGSTFISIGRDNNGKNARIKAAEYGAEVLFNLSDLPCTSLSDLKDVWIQQEFLFKHSGGRVGQKSDVSSEILSREEKTSNEKDSDKNSLHFWLRFATEVKEHVGKNLLAKEVLQATGKTLNNKIFYFHFSEDLESSLNKRSFFCDLVIEKVTICQGKGTSKKRATTNAAENGVLSFLNLIDWYKRFTELPQKSNEDQGLMDTNQNSVENSPVETCHKTPLFRDCKSTRISNTQLVRNNVINKYKSSLRSETLETNASSNSISSSVCEKNNSQRINTKQNPFSLNKALLNNSYQRQLVLFDTSAVRSIHQQTPASILNYSSTFCHKVMKYQVEETPSLSGKPGLYRGHVFFDGEEVGTGEALTKSEAKIIATYEAFEHLRKLVYTIKIKKESEEDFVISRSHVMNVNAPSNTVSENNIGCKMLKMMGWRGGAIGKTGGITEPIAATEHRFKQGLGFEDTKIGMKSFRRNVEALLKDFANANTTSDLIFSTDFKKDERKEIHRIAKRYNLTHSSYGKDSSRQLYLKRKFTVVELLNALVVAGGSTSKYELFDNSM